MTDKSPLYMYLMDLTEASSVQQTLMNQERPDLAIMFRKGACAKRYLLNNLSALRGCVFDCETCSVNW